MDIELEVTARPHSAAANININIRNQILKNHTQAKTVRKYKLNILDKEHVSTLSKITLTAQ